MHVLEGSTIERGICFLGGSEHDRRDLSEEHIPPKGSFPERLHRDLPSFGACVSCNATWSKWDEYFREVLIRLILRNTTLGPIQEVREKIAKAENYRRLNGMRGPLSKFRPIWVQQRSGLIVQVRGLEVDKDIITAVACRVACALYYLVRGVFLDRAAMILANFQDPRFDRPGHIMAASSLIGAKPWMRRHFADRHFQFTWRFDDNDPRSSEWVWCIYGSAYFYAVTLAPGVKQFQSEFLGRTVESRGRPVLVGRVGPRCKVL